jgi:hypothetical protein
MPPPYGLGDYILDDVDGPWDPYYGSGATCVLNKDVGENASV